MKAKFLKIAGVKTDKEFYDKYPTEEAFFAKCGAKIKKAFPGMTIPKANTFNQTVQTFGGPAGAANFATGGIKGGFMQNLTGGKGLAGAIGGLTDNNPVGMVMDTIKGFKAQKERVNQANQNMQVMGMLEDQQSSNKRYEQYNLAQARQQNYVRPEDNMMTGEELFPMYGSGTNVLAKKGVRVMGKKKAQTGGSFLGSADAWKNLGIQGAGAMMPQITQSLGIGGDMGSQIGGKIGGALGSATGIPGMDMVGELALGGLGDLLDRSDTKIKRYNSHANNSINNMIGMNMGNYSQNKFSANAKNGIKAYAMGGDVQAIGEGGIKTLSNNPYSGEMGMIQGPSHENGGVDMNVMGTPIEAEGGEPILRTAEDGTNVKESMSIMGNLKVPKHIKSAVETFSGKSFSGNKYKNVTKSIGEVENKTTKSIQKDIEKADDYTSLRPLDRISLSSLNLNLGIKDKELQKLDVVKSVLASTQEAQNEQDNNTISRNGKKLYAQKGINTKWYEGTEDINKTLEGTPGYNTSTRTNLGSEEFQKTFKKARESGLKEFSWNGKMYNTNLAGDSNKKRKATKPIQYTIEGQNPLYKTEETQDLQPMRDFGSPTSKESTSDNKNSIDLGGIGQLWRDSDAEDFNSAQLLPEVWAMANNKLEPVESQKYNPRLRTPYDISLQDQLNENTASARSAERLAAYNPGALGNLKAQEYMADSRVLGDQFRQNQQFKDQVYSGNLQTLNDAQLKNLAIADTQYTRQAQAKSNTKSTDFEAIKSMTDKQLKHNLENQTLRVMENMYDYRYDPSGRAQYMGEGWTPSNSWGTGSGQGQNQIPEGMEIIGYDSQRRPKYGYIDSASKLEKAGKTPGYVSRNGSLVKKYKKFK